MLSRCLSRLAAVAATTFVAGAGLTTPASAAVTYDPGTKAGFVARADVQKAFGWSSAKLTSRAPGVVFAHEFWTDDTYTASCGKKPFPVVHHKQYGRFELAGTVTYAGDRGAAAYRGKLIGFRITGPRFGISGTSVPPAVGQPCPRGHTPGATIDKIRLVSSATGWSLVATSGTTSRVLTAKQTPPARPASPRPA
ncbi:hypothetical protein [Actinoplanes friuliensis]|uniref:Uncharacterized protein n=1 Tax=Actinoplanes friuliensis DSM 7358 TaxID=1246995 RepID=U5W0A9_9ACTN|nr:hypothetical protein [Actinoplanes friuliensis]AGZ41361.1 hypothetical protein AFR_15395 [Actinoplanes friuliensis DSM 7358]